MKSANNIIPAYKYNPCLVEGCKYDICFYGLTTGIQAIKLNLYNARNVRI